MSMKFLVKAFAAIICLFGAASCIYEDNDDCASGLRVQIVKDSDVFESDSSFVLQSDEARVCVFDASGHYLKSVLITGEQLRSNDFYVDIEDIEAGTYTLIAWIGSQDEDYEFSDLVAGQTTASEALLTVRQSAQNRKDDYLHPLWYGTVTAAVINGQRTEVKVPLKEDTHYLTVLIQDNSGKSLDGDDYNFEITASNGRLNFNNEIQSGESIAYGSYHVLTQDVGESGGNPITGVHAEMSTLRLMADSDARFTVTDKNSGIKILDIDLVEYLLMVRENYEGLIGRRLTDQEYLDCVNHHSIIFFLTPTGVEGRPYICVTLNINGWIVRINNGVLS
jgi:hypothetical protein